MKLVKLKQWQLNQHRADFEKLMQQMDYNKDDLKRNDHPVTGEASGGGYIREHINYAWEGYLLKCQFINVDLPERDQYCSETYDMVYDQFAIHLMDNGINVKAAQS